MQGVQVPIKCMLALGGTPKSAYFPESDLPHDVMARDAILLSIMGSPDARQVDGLEDAHPLTSKVAIISRLLRTARVLLDGVTYVKRSVFEGLDTAPLRVAAQ